MIRSAAAFFLVAGSAAIAASAPVQSEQAPVDLQLRQARTEAAAASAEELRLEKAAANARDEVTRLRAKQMAAAQSIEAAEARITAAGAEVRLVEARLVTQRQMLAREQAPVSALLGGLVLVARRPPLLLLADSASPDEIVKLRLLVAATAPAIRAKTATLSRELDRASALERAALAARDDLKRNRDSLAERRNALAELEQQAAAMASSRGSEALGAGDVALSREERLASVEENARSSRSSAQLARELAELGPVPLRSGGAAIQPLLAYRLPADAPVTDGFGAVSANGVRSRGITLATRRGFPIAAPASGTILFAGPFRDYDGVVIIDHGKGWKSVLVNAGSKVKRGARVQIGEPIGTALGPVEVELQRNGQAVSPALIAGSSAVLSNDSKGG